MPFLGIPSGLTFHRIVVLFRLPLRFATVSYAARLIIDVVHEIGYQKGILLLSQRKICGIHMLPCLISWLFGSLCPAVMSIAPGEPYLQAKQWLIHGRTILAPVYGSCYS